MTEKEKAIVMAYTGVCMLTGDKLSGFYKYVESIMGRPVYTYEMGTKVVDNLIKEKARPDFIALCADESSSENPNKWIPVSERLPEEYADVICCTDAEEVFVASYLGKLDDGSECFDDNNGMMCEGDVIAWMPLPTPYKASPTGAESMGGTQHDD